MSRRRATALVAALSVLAACGEGSDPDRSPPASPQGAVGGPAGLAILRTSAVEGVTGPEGRPFDVRLRTPELTQFPCASCHVGPVTSGTRGTEEHADVQPVHPEGLSERCETCHSRANPGELALQNGETASLDQAYRLCAQCHYAQGDAWAGGAHGKRLAGWRGQRVVMSCTECHDPHAPAFDTRIPFRGPRILRGEAGQP